MNKYLSSQKTQFERHRACVSGQMPQALGGCRPLRTLAKHSVLHRREEKLPHVPPPKNIRKQTFTYPRSTLLNPEITTLLQ